MRVVPRANGSTSALSLRGKEVARQHPHPAKHATCVISRDLSASGQPPQIPADYYQLCDGNMMLHPVPIAGRQLAGTLSVGGRMGEQAGVVARPFEKEAALKRAIRRHFKTLGFTKNSEGELVLPGAGKPVVRQLHRAQRRDRLQDAQPFLERALPRALPFFADGSEINANKIRLALRVVKSDTLEADIFRVATMTWSVPVSVGFGRRMRYLVWDEGHNRLAGLIALGDPVYNLSVRDNAIGWSVHDRADRLVGLLDAYVLGSVPPYSFLLGGKAVACLIRSRDVYADFRAKYGNTVGVISKAEKAANLLAVTTTSSMGRSSIYNRLRLEGEPYFEHLGYTIGWGHFHITDDLFDQMRDFLRTRDHGYADKHTFGEGPNWRLRTIRAALKALRMNETVLRHGIQREVFIARLATNAFDVLRTGQSEPDVTGLLSVAEISDMVVDRWMAPRAARGEIDYRSWDRANVPKLIRGLFDLPSANARHAG